MLMKWVNIYLREERENGIKVDGIKVNAERVEWCNKIGGGG